MIYNIKHRFVFISICCNNFDAENKEDYKNMVKNSFLEDYNLKIENSEIINIEEI